VTETVEVSSTKKCSKCGIEKPLDDFYKSRSGKFGRTQQCKVCHREKYQPQSKLVTDGQTNTARVLEFYKMHSDWSQTRIAREVGVWPCFVSTVLNSAKQKKPANLPTTKACAGCKNIKSIDEFYADQSRTDGRVNYCKECHKGQSLSYLSTRRTNLTNNLPEVPTVKVCIKCKQEKSASEFSRMILSKDGLYYYCKSCVKVYQDKRLRLDPDLWKNNYRRRIEWHRAYYRKNRGTILPRMKVYNCITHREARDARLKKWIKNNLEHYRELHCEARTRRRARKAGAPGSHTYKEFFKLCVTFEWKCVYCEKHTSRLTEDHMMPICRRELNPTNYIESILPACKGCNSSKRDKTPEEWLGIQWLEEHPRVLNAYLTALEKSGIELVRGG
jgi:hypothetical protein